MIENKLVVKINKISQTSSQKTVKKSSQKFLQLVKEDREITIEEISSKMGISDSGVKRIIAKLKQPGRLKRLGPDKGGFWEIIG